MEHTQSNTNTVQEYCSACESQAPHTVTLEIRAEAGTADEVGHSRTPYRITECQQCGASSSRRMNNV